MGSETPGAITRPGKPRHRPRPPDPVLARWCASGGRSPGGIPPGTAGVCGLMAAGHSPRKIPGGSRPALYTVFASVSAGSGPSTRGPYAATSPPPSGRPGRIACGPVPKGLSLGNWMVVCVPPVRRGCRAGRAPRAPQPSS
ncbi:hypothetical protein N7462_008220 [Penicillium macrosclerotiorum]|uniref:uncharacterized protein n=1 Tax=Penicillium macrosclerotiorum TaxID=303699 RepID=UPI002549C086|nr:uncharacterized protein N7462_008220 [Penicillium macrosclerotiorum]KAJ5675323.1 hypothetical protein N7462_008220 [Penicillium macrosclerotiorum]